MKSDRVYIEQMLDSAEKIEIFTKGLDKEKFFQDQKTQSAVIMQLALIGELAKRTAKATQLQIEIPWKEIAGFRDRAIHDYYQIDLEIVWTTVLEDVPSLQKTLQQFLLQNPQ